MTADPPSMPRGTGQPMRIMHVIAPAAFGGLEQVVLALAAGQHAGGHRVVVLAFLETGSAEPSIFGDLADVGVDVRPVVLAPRSYASQRRRMIDAVRELQPQVAHTHGYHCDVLAATTRRARGHPLLSTVHGFTGGGAKNRLYEWLQLRSFARFDAVVAVSRPIEQRLLRSGLRRERVHLLRNAWHSRSGSLSAAEARRALSLDSHAFHVGWIGRFSHEKGPDVMLRALPLLSDLPIHLTMIGSGAEDGALRDMASVLNADGRITWAGYVPDAGRLVRAFDVLVLSSRTEGTPIVLFEALHAEVPVVATAVGGVPDVVSDQEAALVREVSPARVAAAIRDVVTNRGAAVERARRGHRRLSTEFAAAPWVAAYERLYRAIQPPAR